MNDALDRLREASAPESDPARVRAGARAALEFFEQEAALHHRDEDNDLFPLLRVRAAALKRDDLASVIGVLEREHAVMDEHWSRLVPALRDSVTTGSRLDADEVTGFCELYRSHMECEETALHPFARTALDAAELRELLARSEAQRAPKPAD